MTVDDLALRLSAQRALLFNVPSGLQMISIDSNGKTLFMRAVFDGPVESAARDNIYSAAEEIVGDFPQLHESKVDVLEKPSGESPPLRLLVFARADLVV